MIGLMYLVLTAMLAMNVSADLLNAFSLVDSGLTQTTRNYSHKNEKTYAQFEKAELMNKKKVAPWRKKADEIHQQATAINDYVRELKYKIVKLAEGAESPALLGDGEVDSNLISAKSNTDFPAQVMITEGGGKKIKDMLVKFRETALSMLDKERDAQLYEAIEGMLETNDPPATHDGIRHSWESYRFEHIPLIATLPQLTKVQVDALNAEADMMSFLLNRIDAGDFKFNSISAVVIPSGDYVQQGSEFKAQIFLAASDTTQRPKIYLGAYDSVRNKETGEWEYNMRAGQGKDTIPVSPSGRGILKRRASSLGTVHWGGLIEIKGPEGAVIRKPFKHSYTVAASSMAVSPIKMNLMYIGVDNPVAVSVAGVPADKIRVSMTNGSIVKRGKIYIAKPRGVGKCQVIVSTTGGRRVGTQEFRVKRVPDPVASLIGLDTGRPTKGQLFQCKGVTARPKDFDFDVSFKVKSFMLETTVAGSTIEEKSSGSQFSARQKSLIRRFNSGQLIYITNVIAVGPDGKDRKINSIRLKLR